MTTGSESRYPEFYTWCSLCGDGQQEATRTSATDGVAMYESRCIECGDGFPVRVPAGDPASERTAFNAEMNGTGGGRWRESDV